MHKKMKQKNKSNNEKAMNERKQSKFLWMSVIKIVYSNSHNMLLFHLYTKTPHRITKGLSTKRLKLNELGIGTQPSNNHLMIVQRQLVWLYADRNGNEAKMLLTLLSVDNVNSRHHRNKIMKYNKKSDEEIFKRLITHVYSDSTIFIKTISIH